ncbi:PREDICTED: carbonic anhydrase 4 [Sturnus vulgaris]|uniref:carbonic anhydrase 4 n=1 Tax=Sturnus vulgaris TaxID=9172 RepID=UPI00071AAD64|nr:PREDICTED: carbonic anhydrase 4 [Sturnus vulgaris]
MELLLLALSCLHFLKTEAVVGHWCYRSQKCEQPQCKDPPRWHLVNVECKGSRQSPVNIVTKNVVCDKSLKPLTFEGYDVKGSAKWLLENNGHTVKVTLNGSPKIGGGGLKRKYKAVEFHLHWGVPEEPQSIPGSEHSIDGEKYPMELHIVHIREDVSSVTEAKKTPDGLAVLAFFVKADEENRNYTTLLNRLEALKYKGKTLVPGISQAVWGEDKTCSHKHHKGFSPVVFPGDSAELDPLPLMSLLPPEEDLGRYYRYEGSLTTPDCYEGVTWTIFEKPVELSLRQLSKFATLHFDSTNSSAMTENFRPAQPLNGRTVLWSGASIALPVAKLLLLLPLALSCTLSSLCH